MKFFTRIITIMILSLPLYAEFSAKENKLLFILKADTKMENRDVTISGMGMQDAYILKKDIFSLLKEGSYFLLEELLSEHDILIDFAASQIPLGEYNQEGYQGSLLVLKKNSIKPYLQKQNILCIMPSEKIK